MCVVPIKIRYQNTGKEPSIYAVLDSCNQGVFIRKALPKLLEHQDMKHSRNQTHSSLAVENLEIASNGSCNKQWIKLPKSYATEELPVNGKEVATKEKIAKWQNVQKIGKMVCPRE